MLCSWFCAVLHCTVQLQKQTTQSHNWQICRPKQNICLELLGKLLWSEEFSQACSFHVTSKLEVLKLFLLLCAGGPTSILCDDPLPLLTNGKSPIDNQIKIISSDFPPYGTRLPGTATTAFYWPRWLTGAIAGLVRGKQLLQLCLTFSSSTTDDSLINDYSVCSWYLH